MSPDPERPSIRSTRWFFGLLGLLFAGLALWAVLLDPPYFHEHAGLICGAVAAVLLGISVFGSDKWVSRMRGALTGWP